MPPRTSREGQLAGLRDATRALAAAPADAEALAAVAAALEALGRRDEAVDAAEALALAACEAGVPALALAATVRLRDLGSAGRADAALARIARAYAAGSVRVAPARRRPPSPPRPSPRGPAPGGAPVADEARLVGEAVAAVAAARARAAEAERAGGDLPAVCLLGALAAPAFRALAARMRLVEPAAGAVVVDVGDEAGALYLVARGLLSVTRGDVELGRLRAGASFGEIALVGRTRRTARVACVEDSWLLEVPRASIEEAARDCPGLADTLARQARARLLSSTMRVSEIFRRLEPAERERLVARFETRLHRAGEVILREGERGGRLHVVVSGEVEVLRGGAGVAVLGAGDVFGEMSLLGRKPATADVVARGATVTLSLDRASFDDVAIAHPALLAEVYRILVQREADHVHVVADDDVLPV